MRRRILKVAVVAVSVALLLFGVPLAAVARAMIVTEERGELERAALLASAQVGPDFAAGDPVELPGAEPDKQVGVYDATLQRRGGQGPATGDGVVAAAAATGNQSDGQVNADLVVAVPVTMAENVVAVVRAATPMSVVWNGILLAWAALALTAAVALAIAVSLARRQARLISEPLEALAATAEQVGAGDLLVRSPLVGGDELGRLAQTQNNMLDRLTDLLQRERRFSADVSHQLRTPLTGLQLGLAHAIETGTRDPRADLRPALLEAADRARELQRTVEDILNLARADSDWAGTVPLRPVHDVLTDLDHRWHAPLAGQGRALTVPTEPSDPPILVPGFVAAQALAILLDNAVQHGQGRVTVTVRDLADTVAIDITDEGSITLDPTQIFRRGQSGSTSGTGIGLSLARTITESAGGRLLLASASPTRFTLLIPGPKEGHERSARR